jgi:hypothetical protein
VEHVLRYGGAEHHRGETGEGDGNTE